MVVKQTPSSLNPCVPSSHLSPSFSHSLSFSLPTYTTLTFLSLYWYNVLLSLWFLTHQNQIHVSEELELQVLIICTIFIAAYIMAQANYNANKFAL